MLKTRQKLTYLACIPAVIPVAAAMVLYTLCGASALGAVYLWLASFVGIYIPGLLIKDSFFADTAQGIQFTVTSVAGFTFFAVTTLVASATQFYFILPVAVAVMVFLYARQLYRTKDVRRQTEQRDTSAVGLVVFIAAVLVLLNALWAVRYAHPSQVGQLKPSQDFFWNLGNVKSILVKFPVCDLRVSGVTLSYHFLTELIGAGLCMVTGLDAYDVVAFYSYAPVAAALTGCLYELGTQLWKDKKLPSVILAAMPLLLGCASLHKVMESGLGRFGNNIAIHTVSNINGQATAFFALAAFLVLFKRFFEQDRGNGGLVLCGCAFFLLVFSKSPQGAVVAIAFAAAVAVYLIAAVMRKEKLSVKGNKIIFGVVITAGFALLYKLYFSAGADSSMALSLTGTLKSFYFANLLNLLVAKLPTAWQFTLPVMYLAQSFFMAPVVFVLWLCCGVYDLFHLGKTGIMRLMLHAAAVGGYMAFYIFEHYSSSQIYFASLALFCTGVLAVDTAAKLWHNKKTMAAAAKVVVVAMAAVGVLTNGCFAGWLAVSAGDWINGNAVSESQISVTAAEEAAGLWLAENSTQDMYFATNRMHTGTAMEGLSNIYSGLSGRQAYCESFKYAVSNMGDQGGTVYKKYDTMCLLFEESSSETNIKQICSDCNIHYIVYNPLFPGSDKPLKFMPVVFEQDGIKIYKAQ